MADTKKDTKSTSSYKGILWDGKVKEWSAADAAWWNEPKKSNVKPRGNVILPNLSEKVTVKEEVNQSTKYPWLTLEEEAQIDSNPQLSNIAKERVYKEMYDKKQERAWLDDRANIRKQYISKQATTWNEDEDNALINMWRALDWVREEIIKAGGKGVNKKTDMELVNILWESNPYTAQIINAVSKWDITPEYATYFLLNGDEYKNAVEAYAQQNPAWENNTQKSSGNAEPKRKAWFIESFVEWAFWAVKWAAKTAFKQGTNMMADYMLAWPRAIGFLATWKDITQPLKDAAWNIIDEATWQWDETVNWNRRFDRAGKILGDIVWEAWLMVASGWLWEAALAGKWYQLWSQIWTKLAASKYAPQIAKGIETLDTMWNTTVWKVGKWILWRVANWIEDWLTIQWVSDMVEWDLSSAKDYMSSIEWATLLWAVWDFVWLWFKKFANPWKKISEIVKGDGWLNSKQIIQLENEVKAFNSTNRAENPFRTRATEVKNQALPKLENDIKILSDERDALVKPMINDWKKATYDYLDEVNKTLRDADLGNINIVKWKNGKWKVSWGTTAGSEAESQLKEFIDMINAQSDWGTKSLVDTIKAAKQIAKEAKIAWKTNKMTKAITDFSTKLEEDAKALYPNIWADIWEKNSALSELLGTKKKIIDLWDDYSALAWKMNSDTDFYNFMEELYKNKYTTEHMWNKTLWTYYTLWLRAPELLSEQAKLFYPSVPWLEEAWLKYLQKQAKQAYWGLWAIAWQETTTPLWAWSKMASDVYVYNQ